MSFYFFVLFVGIVIGGYLGVGFGTMIDVLIVAIGLMLALVLISLGLGWVYGMVHA